MPSLQTYSIWYRNLVNGMLTLWCLEQDGLEEELAYARTRLLRGKHGEVILIEDGLDPNRSRETKIKR